MTTSVLIVDDDDAARGGLRSILETADDIVVIAEAADADAAFALARELEPDVALMDIGMPGADGIEATRMFAAAGLPTRVLVVTLRGDDEFLPYRALRAGASGFLLKRSTRDLLVAGVRAVAAGEALLDPAVTRRLIAKFAPPADPSDVADLIDRLTPREREVLVLIGRGRSNDEIGRELHMARSTVKTHVSALLNKLDQRDRVQLAILAHDAGLVGADLTARGPEGAGGPS